jgi:MoaA/NifB/PqqE/SkfB family radical SAM enzyme
MSDLITAREMLGRRIQLKLLRDKEFQIPCYAANLMGVIKSNGDVFACELRDDKLGNVRDFDHDFRKLWLSDRARAISRDIIDNKCYCTHECFMSTNILFNPRLYPALAAEVLKLRRARRRGPTATAAEGAAAADGVGS